MNYISTFPLREGGVCEEGGEGRRRGNELDEKSAILWPSVLLTLVVNRGAHWVEESELILNFRNIFNISSCI